MAQPSPSDLTRLLTSARDGNPDAFERLWPLVMDDLRRVARSLLKKESRRDLLQTTVLTNEAWLKLAGGGPPPEHGRELFAHAAKCMREYLVDVARNRKRLKRGGGRTRVELAEHAAAEAPDPVNLLAVEEAIAALEQRDPQMAELVRLRYWGGQTGDEVAAVLGISPRQVDKQWMFARAWLRRALE